MRIGPVAMLRISDRHAGVVRLLALLPTQKHPDGRYRQATMDSARQLQRTPPVARIGVRLPYSRILGIRRGIGRGLFVCFADDLGEQVRYGGDGRGLCGLDAADEDNVAFDAFSQIDFP